MGNHIMAHAPGAAEEWITMLFAAALVTEILPTQREKAAAFLPEMGDGNVAKIVGFAWDSVSPT